MKIDRQQKTNFETTDASNVYGQQDVTEPGLQLPVKSISTTPLEPLHIAGHYPSIFFSA